MMTPLRAPRFSVLIACSSAPLRAHLRALLNREADFCLCCETDTGAAALDLFFRYRPNVVLVDVALPDRNGFMVVECIKRAVPSCCVVLLCHASDPCVDEVGRLVGADHVCHTCGELNPILALLRNIADTPGLSSRFSEADAPENEPQQSDGRQ